MTTVAVFDGIGFAGRRLAKRLAAERVSVCIAVRMPFRLEAACARRIWIKTRSFLADMREASLSMSGS